MVIIPLVSACKYCGSARIGPETGKVPKISSLAEMFMASWMSVSPVASGISKLSYGPFLMSMVLLMQALNFRFKIYVSINNSDIKV